MTNPSRGEIYWIDWNPARGSEQAGRRPALVVSTDQMNRNPAYPNCIVVALSTKGRSAPMRIELEPSKENGLPAHSWAKTEQIMAISKDRLNGRMGQITDEQMNLVEGALGKVLGFGIRG